MSAWRIAAALAALAAYAVLSHALMVHAPRHPWTVAALFGPMVAAIGIAGWTRRHGPTLLGAAACIGVLGWVVAQGGVSDMQRLYVLQHGAIHALIGWTFAITLRPGATPLITAMAQRVHTRFPPALRAYTRGLTQAWVVYFAVMIAVSVLIYALAPWPVWSFFCNIITPLAAGLFFAVELAFRRWRHPEFERVTIARAVQAYRAATAR